MASKIPFEPRFAEPELSGQLVRSVRRLSGQDTEAWINTVKEWVSGKPDLTKSDCLRFASCLSLLLDFKQLGLKVVCSPNGLRLERPSEKLLSDRESQQRAVRSALVAARDSQLSQKSNIDFINRMEAPGKGSRKTSVFSLFRDGTSLARRLREVSGRSSPHDALREEIKPYLQVVEEGVTDTYTGHPLGDIWRYFRHTWLTPYRTTPGRSLSFIIRDAAVEPHPVIGIAGLASPVVRMKARDVALGIDPESTAEAIASAPTFDDREYVARQLNQSISSIYVRDFIRMKVLFEEDLVNPTETALAALKDQASRYHPSSSAQLHRGKENQRQSLLEREAETPLYAKKRATALTQLLNAKMLLKPFLEESAEGGLKDSLSERGAKSALITVLRMAKSERTGTNMMDINVCGSVAPYNHLLGGKLVALMMLSAEARIAYATRYKNSESVIASRMAGRPIGKPSDLVTLTTSGIFAGHSSQYNRLKIPAGTLSDAQTELSYRKLGETEAYSTLHLSDLTVSLLQEGFQEENKYKHVNSKFGEGVSPRLRKIRQQIDAMDLDPDELLRSGQRRTLYGVHLAHNAADYLMGRTDNADFILASNVTESAERIAEYWRTRWLLSRLNYLPALDKVKEQNVHFPKLHGASVRLPKQREVQYSFEEFSEEVAFDEEH